MEAEFNDELHPNLKKDKGAYLSQNYLPQNMAYPQRYVLDSRIIGTDDAEKPKLTARPHEFPPSRE